MHFFVHLAGDNTGGNRVKALALFFMQFLQAHFSTIPMEATKSVAEAARFVARHRTVSTPPRYAYVQGEKLDRLGRSR